MVNGRPDMTPASGEKVLVIQPLPGIGDMVWFIPHLRAIARTTATRRISLLTKSRSLADRLLSHEGIIEEFIWIDHAHTRAHSLKSVWAMATALKRRRFSHVWIMHHSPRYALAAVLAGIPNRSGYGLERLQRLMLTDKRALPRRSRCEGAIERGDAFLRLHDIRLEGRDLGVDPEALTRIRSRFAGMPEPWIGLGIGSSEPRKRWSLARFADLATKLDPDDAFTVFLCGAEHEAEDARRIADLARQRGKAPVPVVDLPLNESVALISRCRLFVGNDSSLMNIAASLGVETVGLFGDGVILDYRRNLHAVAPAGAASMAGISVDRVLALIEGKQLKPPL